MSVVFPASICAAIPILRVRSSGKARFGELGLVDWALASSVADMAETGCVHRKQKPDSDFAETCRRACFCVPCEHDWNSSRNWEGRRAIRALQPNIVRGSRKVKKPDRQAREKFLSELWRQRCFKPHGPLGRTRSFDLRRSSSGFSASFRAQLAFGLDPVAHFIARQIEFADGVRRCSRRAGDVICGKLNCSGVLLLRRRPCLEAWVARAISLRARLRTIDDACAFMGCLFGRSLCFRLSGFVGLVFLLLRHHFDSSVARLPSRLAGFAK